MNNNGMKSPQPLPPLLPGPTPDTFRVVGWKVFVPGWHKGQLYTPDDCAKTVRNFGLLSTGDQPHLRVKAKFGHDSQERIAKSLGVMNAGLVTDCRPTPDGGFAIDVDGIPATLMIPAADTGEPVAFDLKAAFEAGNICDGSVELVWDTYPDPAEPTRMLDGPVLEAVAFLGEERPGVPGLPQPVATFAAGPNPDNHARRPTRRRVVFSEVDPMPPRDQLLQQLMAAGFPTDDPAIAGLSDAELANMLKVAGSEVFGAAMKKKYAAQTPMPDANPATKPGEQVPPPKVEHAADPTAAAIEKLSAQFAAYTESCEKRFSAVEQGVKSLTEKTEPAVAFSAEVVETRIAERDRQAEDAVAEAVALGKVSPAQRQYILADLKKLPFGRREAFAAGTPHAGKTPFQVGLDELKARPSHTYFVETPDPVGDDVGVPSDFVKRAASHSPLGQMALRAAAK